MHQHATWGAEAALAGVDSVEHVNVFGQLAPQGFWLAEPAKLNPFEYGGWLWRWLGDLDPRADAVRRLYDGLIAAGTVLDPTLVLYAAPRRARRRRRRHVDGRSGADDATAAAASA